MLTFYVGLLWGMSTLSCQAASLVTVPVQKCPECPNPTVVQAVQKQPKDATFPPTLSRMFVDMATVPQDDFNDLVEIGVPLDDTKEGAESVVVLYTSRESLPQTKARHGLEAETALKNCQSVKVILQESAAKKGQQCIAIVPQWESYHIHKFMRLLPQGGALDNNLPLKYVSRSHQDKGTYQGRSLSPSRMLKWTWDRQFFSRGPTRKRRTSVSNPKLTKPKRMPCWQAANTEGAC